MSHVAQNSKQLTVETTPAAGQADWQSSFEELEIWEILEEIDRKVSDRVAGKITDEDVRKEESGTRAAAAHWALKHLDRPLNVLLALDGISEYAYLHMRLAKWTYFQIHASLWHCHNEVDRDLHFFTSSKVPAKTKEVRRLCLKVTALSNLVIGLAPYLDPSFVEREMRLRAKCHALYGLSLAYLDRFRESHRHLTSAVACISKSMRSVDPVQLAVIRLRRAEAYLVEALRIRDLQYEVLQKENERVRALAGLGGGGSVDMVKVHIGHAAPKGFVNRAALPSRVVDVICVADAEKVHLSIHTDLIRMRWSNIDDAATMLDQAEKGLSGRSHHSVWWGRLHALRLRAFVADLELENDIRVRLAGKERKGCSGLDRMVNKRSLIRRRPLDYEHKLKDWFYGGLLSTSHSPLRQLKIIDYFLCAKNAMANIGTPTAAATSAKDSMQGARQIVDTHFRRIQDLRHPEDAKQVINRIRIAHRLGQDEQLVANESR